MFRITRSIEAIPANHYTRASQHAGTVLKSSNDEPIAGNDGLAIDDGSVTDDDAAIAYDDVVAHDDVAATNDDVATACSSSSH